MPSPAQVTLDLTPSSRLDVIDVRRVLRRTYGDQLSAFPHALYVSYHTTTGYVDQREVEPANADSHLAFIGVGLNNCATYEQRSTTGMARTSAPVAAISPAASSGSRPRIAAGLGKGL